MQLGLLKRRDFITLLGGAAAWPLTARAQQANTLPTIGFLGTSASAWAPWTAVFVQRLSELGWIEGGTVAIEYRWGEGRAERYAEVAVEFVRLKVSVIVASGAAGPALKHATLGIPIVMTIANDLVGSGLVESLARPGGNITGLSLIAVDLAGKRLEILREIIPGVRRLAILSNPISASEVRELQDVARTLGLEVDTIEVRGPEDLAPAIEPLKGRVDALYLCADALTSANRVRINALALAERLPTVSGVSSYVEAGGLISYGPRYRDLFRRAAEFTDKILRGAKPGDLPVEQPTTFELLVNLKSAKTLDLDVPPTLLACADEVIE
jgi:putative tryptophan/tyrosine transport system substrate-binding protein